MTRRMLLAVALTASLGTLALGPVSWAGEAQITIDNFTFTPAVTTVPAGSKVTWINHDDIPHMVVGQDDKAALKSPALDTDDSFSFTFAKAGTYRFFCAMHPQMQGTIVVR